MPSGVRERERGRALIEKEKEKGRGKSHPVFIRLTCIIRCDKSVEAERSKVEFVIKLGAESLDLASQLQKAEKQ